jgi:hypothetical protein
MNRQAPASGRPWLMKTLQQTQGRKWLGIFSSSVTVTKYRH